MLKRDHRQSGRVTWKRRQMCAGQGKLTLSTSMWPQNSFTSLPGHCVRDMARHRWELWEQDKRRQVGNGRKGHRHGRVLLRRRGVRTEYLTRTPGGQGWSRVEKKLEAIQAQRRVGGA